MEEGILLFYVNGVPQVVREADPETTLLSYLRKNGWTSPKGGCKEGGCGSCSVMLSRFTGTGFEHLAINSCITPLVMVEGCAIVTAEGIGSTLNDRLHPVQKRMSDSHGSQCGFCTPGIVMAMYALLRNNPSPTQAEIEENLDGNLCRCTGYRPILDAFKTFACDYSPPPSHLPSHLGHGHHNGLDLGASPAEIAGAYLPMALEEKERKERKRKQEEGREKEGANGQDHQKGKEKEEKRVAKICPSTGRPCTCTSPALEEGGEDGLVHQHPPYPPSCEPIFPSELQRLAPRSLVFRNPQTTYFRPTSLQELLGLKAEFPEAKLVIGNSELGIEKRFKASVFRVLIGATHVPELNLMSWVEGGLEVGMSVTLTKLMRELKRRLMLHPPEKEYQSRVFEAYVQQLKWFAGTQIRNVSSLGGNILTASPISDLNPIHMAAGCTLTLQKLNGPSRVVLLRDFFLSYRKVDIHPDEVAIKLFIPFTSSPNEYILSFKQARRREDDIAIVNSCIRVRLDSSQPDATVEAAFLSFGGMAPKSVNAAKTEEFLRGRQWNQETLHKALEHLKEDLPLAPNAPGGMIEYRKSLTQSFFFKFFLFVRDKHLHNLSPKELSAIHPLERGVSHGLQYYEKGVNKAEEIVGKPVKHLAGDLHVTGEAKYVDDIELPPSALHGVLLLSSKPHARIVKIDTSQASSVEGFVSFVCSSDLKGDGRIGPVRHDENVFEDKIAPCVGAVMGVVVGKTEKDALEAMRLIKVTYEELPAIITIDEAIKAGSFLIFKDKAINDGDVDGTFKKCDHVIEGEVRIGGQEHFYLETQVTYVEPRENQEFMVLSSTQAPTKTQALVAQVLGVPRNRVVVKTKRMGGGFGGKETRNIYVSCAAAVAAQKLKRPIKINLDRDVDMRTSGQRHPYLARYKVGFNNDGSILALDAQLYSNGGYSLDLSEGVFERSLFHIDNAYKIPNLRVSGNACRTNLPTNTAFRGFGAPQAMFVAETVMDHVARVLQVPKEGLMERHLYKEGELTHFRQPVVGNILQPIWKQLWQSSEFEKRKAEIDHFNQNNRWKKRGISIIPTKFGMSFTVKAMNAAGALVHVYTDGSVLVSHGGTEMGQGLHTKIAQIAADVFRIPLSKIYLEDTSTDKVANTNPTAASVSSDLNGMAVFDACQQIAQRLLPVYKKLGENAPFPQVAQEAFAERIDLSAHGYYITPDIGYNFEKKEGKPFHYFAYGAACSEVEIDVLTGDYVVLRSDVIHDVGRSLNSAIDIGQIEGAFVQGLGLFTLEELVWNKDGSLFTMGPSTYKIPSFNDIPVDFRVSLADNPHPLNTIHSSKGVGEPPLFLGATVYFAIKEAIYAARKEEDLTSYFRLDSPATSERIRMACVDQVVRAVVGTEGAPSYIANMTW